MFIPPIPAWDGIHPLLVHFPIALLLVAPLFVIVGLVFFRHRKPYFVSALLLMALGTLGAYLAVSSGEAGATLVERTPAISKALEDHEELAETTRLIFTILTVVFAVLVIAPVFLRKEIGRFPITILNVVFLVLYLSGTIVLADTAHMGGLLVHEYGVQAMVATGGVDPSGSFFHPAATVDEETPKAIASTEK